jgi:hypothetical protein
VVMPKLGEAGAALPVDLSSTAADVDATFCNEAVQPARPSLPTSYFSARDNLAYRQERKVRKWCVQ